MAPTTSLAAPWRFPPEALLLGRDEVHVWRATLDETPSRIDEFLHTLSADERTRAERLHFSKDRARFIVARGVLRAILGLYLNRAPECLAFSYSSHGKPSLTWKSGDAAIRFNISHSHGMALYAVTRAREIGIDLEFIRGGLEAEQIAERFFSHREITTLRALAADLRESAFFRCWTRKEAYIKAKGEGLSLPLDQFDVSLTPGEPAALLNTDRDPNEAHCWSLLELTPSPSYAAALAVEGHGWCLSCWDWRSRFRIAR